MNNLGEPDGILTDELVRALKQGGIAGNGGLSVDLWEGTQIMLRYGGSSFPVAVLIWMLRARDREITLLREQAKCECGGEEACRLRKELDFAREAYGATHGSLARLVAGILGVPVERLEELEPGEIDRRVGTALDIVIKEAEQRFLH